MLVLGGIIIGGFLMVVVFALGLSSDDYNDYKSHAN